MILKIIFRQTHVILWSNLALSGEDTPQTYLKFCMVKISHGTDSIGHTANAIEPWSDELSTATSGYIEQMVIQDSELFPATVFRTVQTFPVINRKDSYPIAKRKIYVLKHGCRPEDILHRILGSKGSEPLLEMGQQLIIATVSLQLEVQRCMCPRLFLMQEVCGVKNKRSKISFTC